MLSANCGLLAIASVFVMNERVNVSATPPELSATSLKLSTTPLVASFNRVVTVQWVNEN